MSAAHESEAGRVWRIKVNRDSPHAGHVCKTQVYRSSISPTAVDMRARIRSVSHLHSLLYILHYHAIDVGFLHKSYMIENKF